MIKVYITIFLVIVAVSVSNAILLYRFQQLKANYELLQSVSNANQKTIHKLLEVQEAMNVALQERETQITEVKRKTDDIRQEAKQARSSNEEWSNIAIPDAFKQLLSKRDSYSTHK